MKKPLEAAASKSPLAIPPRPQAVASWLFPVNGGRHRPQMLAQEWAAFDAIAVKDTGTPSIQAVQVARLNRHMRSSSGLHFRLQPSIPGRVPHYEDPQVAPER